MLGGQAGPSPPDRTHHTLPDYAIRSYNYLHYPHTSTRKQNDSEDVIFDTCRPHRTFNCRVIAGNYAFKDVESATPNQGYIFSHSEPRVISWSKIDTANMYPPAQSFKPYHDTSSEEASLHDGEDQTFLEKPEAGLKVKTRLFSLKKLRSCCVNINASVISCLISLLTALLVVVAILVLAPENPIKVVTERLHMSRPSPPVLLHGANGPSATKPFVKPAGALQHMHCGSTPSEARALGCQFDVMSFAWTPPACFDAALSAHVQATTGPWIFYLDHNATQPIPSHDRLTNEMVVWTEHSYHASHCNYAWERIHRAYLNQLLLPAEIASLNHSLHCMDLLNDMKVDTDQGKKVNAIAYMVFDSCVNLNTGEGDVGDGMMFGHEGMAGH